MEEIMRIRRSVIAPTVLAIGTIGSLVAGPVLALTSSAAPAVTSVAASSVKPDAIVFYE
jgi:hypothetical protein